MGSYYNINGFGQRHGRFCRYVGNKANTAAKELNTTNINTKAAAPNRKTGLSF